MTVQFDEDRQRLRLDDLRKQEEEGLAEAMARKFGVPYVDLTATPINIDSLRMISEAEARESMCAVFNEVDKVVSLGVLSPQNSRTQESISNLMKKGYHVEVYMVSHASLNKVWNLYKDLSYSFETKSGALDISNDQITEFLSQVHTIGDVQKMIGEVLAMKKSYRITRIMEIILAGAISLNASDVHIEPESDYVRIRYRLDGMLTDILEFDKGTYTLLLSRVKLVSNLKLNVQGSQDGRFSIIVRESEIEIRTSVLPGGNGESVVLRVLNPDAISVPLEELGINPRLLKIVLNELNKPNAIHIFAYGEAQIISDEVNFKTSVSSFTKLQDVIDDIKALKPSDVEAKDYHAINIFTQIVQYISNEGPKVGTYKLEYSQLNATKLNDLIEEFRTLKAAEVTNP
jgi:hypothetical protein